MLQTLNASRRRIVPSLIRASSQTLPKIIDHPHLLVGSLAGPPCANLQPLQGRRAVHSPKGVDVAQHRHPVYRHVHLHHTHLAGFGRALRIAVSMT